MFHTCEVAVIVFSYKDYISRVLHYSVLKCSVTARTDKQLRCQSSTLCPTFSLPEHIKSHIYALNI